MERYLLFDSGCSTCAAIARKIEQEVKSAFAVRSLREPEIQALLNRANPDWSWEPTWLEVSDDGVRAYTGLTMRLRLVRRLGLRPALWLMQLVNHHVLSAGVDSFDPGRRRFLRQSGSALAALLLGWPKAPFLRENRAETPRQ